jgi:hypothetical protein
MLIRRERRKAPMSSSLFPRWRAPLYKLVILALAVSGIAQMPIFKRYYLADLPGLGWLADFYLTHIIHYVGAVIFIVLAFQALTRYVRDWHPRMRITTAGWLRLLPIALLVVTGVLRVLKNRPEIVFGPTAVYLIDFAHLGGALWLALAVLIASLARRSAYLVRVPHT